MKVIRATGRRKTSVAQVRLIPSGSGKIVVNKKELSDYLPIDVQQTNVIKPLTVVELEGNFDVKVIVRGGGPSGQTGAIQLGIARALVDFDETLKPKLKSAGLLTRDPRMVERKKYGLKKARKRFQFSKR